MGPKGNMCIRNSSAMSSMGKVCVNCGERVKELYIQYSPGNIRLIKCESCKAIVDPYIECDLMIILIDLILHKPKAYRHVLYNMFPLDGSNLKGILWKASLIYFVLDACKFLLLRTAADELESSSLSFMIRTCGKVLADILSANLLFFTLLLYETRVLSSPSYNLRYKEFLLGIIISSYFKMFILATMVWNFPTSVYFITDVFVLSSNAVALKVLTRLGALSCFGICFGAHSAKFLMSNWAVPWICG